MASRPGFSEPIPTSRSSAVPIQVGLGLGKKPRESEKCRRLNGLSSQKAGRQPEGVGSGGRV